MQKNYKPNTFILTLLITIIQNTPCSETKPIEPAESVEEQLKKLNLELPQASKSFGTYAHYVIAGNLIFISGQLPTEYGILKYAGKIGETLTEEQGVQAAQSATMQVMSQLQKALDGSFNRVKQCVKITVFINAVDSFTNHPTIANGASNLIVSLLGSTRGKHARAAVGVSSLPLNAPVEIEAIFELESK